MDKLCYSTEAKIETVATWLEFILIRVAVILFFLFVAMVISGGVKAQDAQTSTGLACDTPQQAEKFVKMWDGDWRTTLQKVNAEEGEHACIVDSFAFIKGNEVSRATNERGTFSIVEALVVAIATPQGLAQIPPQVWYILFKAKDDRI